ncbi:unnamed protein product [Periconia digitata]|uniref:Uncharacterized protein n=1 Tax=Periconia digitata TaxID=1303443 RepID=A0A9W4XQG1_9PLEO|nr:unnamed protein product [Periconia digitata]
MSRANFTECGARYMSDPKLVERYSYRGPVRLNSPKPQTQITHEGCLALCGRGNEYYSWPAIAATVTTWILPILGTLLQAPFESNAFWRTIKAINRWIGSPVSSLTFILWDIQISGNCALFVDMATPYEAPIPNEDSEFSSIRDSFYILMNLNQYKMKPVISMTREAEGLLRIVLFSQDLKLVGTRKTLSRLRKNLARDLRINRRRGVVPVFISTLAFVVALGLSIEAAFSEVGSNLQAHALALGLFSCWFPILILCSILDRNPVASDDIQRKLNKMVDLACRSLQDTQTRNNYISSFRDLPQAQKMGYWVQKIASKAQYIEGDYFCGFAGQARTRFHYGAAHAILVDIEKAYLAERGRNWLANPREARASLVLGQVDYGFTWFDGRACWQLMASVLLVGGTSAGAFVLSFNTPTVGLGCRTGGYLIFFAVALTLLVAEMLVWWLTSPLRKRGRFIEHLDRYTRRAHREPWCGPKRPTFEGLVASSATLTRCLQAMEEFIVHTVLTLIRLFPFSHKASKLETAETALRTHFEILRHLTTRNWLQRVIFTPLELGNMIWLCYLLTAQTIGAFNNCTCLSSIWGGFGGYLDFETVSSVKSPSVEKYWQMGTIITCTTMGLGMAYIVLEWLLQAHLSTEDYKDAARGLVRVRRFRRYTYWIRYPSSLLVVIINNSLSAMRVRKSSERKVLVWSKETKYRPTVGQTIMSLATDAQNLPFQGVVEASVRHDENGDAEHGASERGQVCCVCKKEKRSVEKARAWDEEIGECRR